MEIVAETLRQPESSEGNTPPLWLRKVRERLDDDFCENITIKTLAELADVHPTHLAGEFRRHFRLTIGDYLRQKRITLAKEKLLKSKMPISEIALLSGFFDQSHLTRIFRKTTGMTPAVYRKSFSSH